MKPLSIIALEEQHAHFESVIQKVQSAVVNGEKEELKSVSTQETARQLLLDIEKIATEGQLKESDFSFRYIQSLPEKFGAMLSLEQLNLSGNSLEVTTIFCLISFFLDRTLTRLFLNVPFFFRAFLTPLLD